MYGTHGILRVYQLEGSQWDYARNASIGITPDNVLFKSCEYAYWKCHDCEHEWKCVLANRTMHDTGYPQCVRLKSDEDDDFAMMLSHEFPDSRIEHNVLNAMCAC